MCTQEAHQLWTNFGKRNSKQRFSSFFVWDCAVWVQILSPALFAKEAPNIGVKHILIPASNSQNFESYDNLKISKFQKKWHFQRSAGGKMTIFFYHLDILLKICLCKRDIIMVMVWNAEEVLVETFITLQNTYVLGNFRILRNLVRE